MIAPKLAPPLAGASEATTILVDDQTAVARPGPAPQSGDRAASLIKGLHEAQRGGAIWEVLVFLTGVTPLLFFVTGVMMWLRGRKAADVSVLSSSRLE